MNVKTITTACLFAALNVCAIAAHAGVQTHSAHPDIQKIVTHSVDSSSSCVPVNNHLTYLDSEGQTHTFDYQTFSNACN